MKKNTSNCSKEKDELSTFKKRLTNLYKIHLMPNENDVLHVTQILINALKQDSELGSLINTFKITDDLSLSYQSNPQLPFPMIVIYPAEGKDKVERLVQKLADLFKQIKGMDLVPRYNLKINDLIFYAQSDADYKSGGLLDYFDSATNYALYINDFEGSYHDYTLKI